MPVATAPSASLQTLRNIGRAYFEQGKYAEAIEQFQKVVASGSASAMDHMNLGMALMQANKPDAALGELTTARQMDPNLVAAEYNLGILYKRELRYPESEAALKRVITADPQDPAAWFNLGTVFFAGKKLDESLDAYRHVIDLGFGRGQNFYVASLFRSFTVLVRMKRQDDAQKVLKQWEGVHEKVPNISLQDPALEGGKYGTILTPSGPPLEISGHGSLEKVTFAEFTQKLGLVLPVVNPALIDPRQPIKAADYSPEFARRNLLPLFGASVAVGDYDNDGKPDLYVVIPSAHNHLLHNTGDGTFTDVTEKAGVAGPGGSLSAIFADYDNSGKMCLFVTGLDGVKVYRYAGEGVFEDVTEKAGLKPEPGEVDTRTVLFDADNDGFLDLIVTAYTNLNQPPPKDSFRFPEDFPGATVHFYRNNGDGSFTEKTTAAGLAAAKGRMRGAVFADFSGRGYSDLMLLRDDGPPFLFQNQGEDRFVLEHETGALAKSVALEAQVADFNHDGWFDLAVWTPEGYQVLINQRDGKFTPVAAPAIPAPAGFFAFRGAVADLNGDSFPDLLAADAQGKLHFLINQGGRLREGSMLLPLSDPATLASVLPTWLENPGRLDLVAMTRSGQLLAFAKEGPPSRWVEVKMNGYKSNSRGIGSVVEFKAGNYYNKVVVTSSPIRVFTGDLAKLDVIRVTWPNAVVQNWIDVATDKQIEVRESERLASSCPFLYVWNGRKFVYVTDVLGVAPLGELAPDGTRVKPDPEEFVRLPEPAANSRGNYVFQLTNEMREADFFDQVKLMAVDHPATEEVYANEIYATNPAPPALYAVPEKRFPISAVDDHGNDVLPLLLEQDGRYPTDFARNRILGMAELHSLTLDLGSLAADAPVSLWLNGWVFWTDSNGARAMESNPQLPMVSPYLQVRDASGKWVTVIPDMGLPSGTNRTMRVDLAGKFLSPDRHVRIVTNLCVYWDQIFFTTHEAPAPAPVALPLVAADLHYRGFSAFTTDPAHVKPDAFDYQRVLANAPWNPLRGRYTRYGPVDQLLTRTDDQMVVMATGDEMTVEFNPHGLPAVRPGWKRDFFLALRGYAKDGEPNTSFAWTVEPMPFGAMSNYPPGASDRTPDSPEYREYLGQYQTRPGYALIPPLAPAIY
ncbi:MAG TPA: FG-GAP-like repeat-containing protein [Terriglobia bacterium]|nr:FG-GAP-like repeat-containing protein [Terriglobia bacterium]